MGAKAITIPTWARQDARRLIREGWLTALIIRTPTGWIVTPYDDEAAAAGQIVARLLAHGDG